MKRDEMLKLAEHFQEYIKTRHNANIGWWNDNYAFKMMEDVVKPAIAALRASAAPEEGKENAWVENFEGTDIIDDGAYTGDPRLATPTSPSPSVGTGTQDHLRQIKAFASVISERNFLDIALHIGRQADEALSLASAQSKDAAR